MELGLAVLIVGLLWLIPPLRLVVFALIVYAGWRFMVGH